jgi:hypothetical protein
MTPYIESVEKTDRRLGISIQHAIGAVLMCSQATSGADREALYKEITF